MVMFGSALAARRAPTSINSFYQFIDLDRRPPFGGSCGVSEGAEEEDGDDGAGFPAGGFGAAPYLRRPVQEPLNPPLLVERWGMEWD